MLDGRGLRNQFGFIAVKRHHVGHDRFTQRQRAGLVEGDGFGACQHFDDRAALHQHAVACRSRKAGGDGRGNGNDQRAGATDKQESEAAIDPGIPVAEADERRHDDGECGNRHDQRHVITREALDEAFRRGAGILRFLNKRDDAGNGVVFRRAVDTDAQRAIMVDRTGKDARALFLGDGNAFAGHRRFVDAGLTFHDNAIGGDAVAGACHDHLADAHLIGSDLPKRAVFFHQRRFRQQRTERLDAGAGARGRETFQQFANGEQQHDNGRLFRLTNDDRADGGNRHQHLDGEDRAETGGVEGISRDREKRGQRGDDKGIAAPCREGQFRRIGDGDQHGAGEGVACFRGAPPRAFFIRAMGVPYLGALARGGRCGSVRVARMIVAGMVVT